MSVAMKASEKSREELEPRNRRLGGARRATGSARPRRDLLPASRSRQTLAPISSRTTGTLEEASVSTVQATFDLPEAGADPVASSAGENRRGR